MKNKNLKEAVDVDGEKRFYLMNVEDELHEYGRWCKPVLEDGETGKQYEHALDVMNLLNNLYEEKEYWKGQSCNDSSLNSILFNELSIAEEQGYELSTAYKKFIKKSRKIGGSGRE